MSLVFIDKGVSGFQSLYDDLSKNNDVYLLDSNQNPFLQISNIIALKTNISSIHIFSHGGPGVLNFANGSISSKNISYSGGYLHSIGNSLGPNGDILFYGCNVAQGYKGLKFVKLFSELSKSDIAASDNISGPNDLSGDWDLEIISGGAVESAFLMPSTFSGTLGTPSISNCKSK